MMENMKRKTTLRRCPLIPMKKADEVAILCNTSTCLVAYHIQERSGTPRGRKRYCIGWQAR
jgi:hypothetical protein